MFSIYYFKKTTLYNPLLSISILSCVFLETIKPVNVVEVVHDAFSLLFFIFFAYWPKSLQLLVARRKKAKKKNLVFEYWKDHISFSWENCLSKNSLLSYADCNLIRIHKTKNKINNFTCNNVFCIFDRTYNKRLM